MASSKVMKSSDSRNTDLARHSTSSACLSPPIRPQQLKRESICDQTNKPGGYSERSHQFASTMTVDGILHDVYGSSLPIESTLLDASITLMDAPVPLPLAGDRNGSGSLTMAETSGKSVDDVWREIVSGERKEMKEEEPDEMMTLEDFLVKAGAVEEEEMHMKVAPERLGSGAAAFDPVTPNPFQMLDKVEGSIVAYGNGAEVYGRGGGGGGGRNKKGRLMMEPLDKAAAQRQRRMIKNRESAARSRERKQAYQVELESLAARLEVENEQLLKEKAERTKERYKTLMEKVIPVVEKRRPTRALRRVQSLDW